MASCKPITISRGAFAFCKYTVAIILWCSVFFKIRELVALVFVILLFSAILKVRRAPLIILYTYTIDKIFPSENVVVDEKGIRFAHIIGTIVSFICLILLYWINPLFGWILTIVLAILKSSAAFGFCSALKLHQCMNSGNCCRIGSLIRKMKK